MVRYAPLNPSTDAVVYYDDSTDTTGVDKDSTES